MNSNVWEISSQISKLQEWDKWAMEIPYISFPPNWKVRVIPPFLGAIVRFRVWVPGMSDRDHVSVYLDCYDHLGCFGSPYWEVYPYKGDIGRCEINNIQELLQMISDREGGYDW